MFKLNQTLHRLCSSAAHALSDKNRDEFCQFQYKAVAFGGKIWVRVFVFWHLTLQAFAKISIHCCRRLFLQMAMDAIARS